MQNAITAEALVLSLAGREFRVRWIYLVLAAGSLLRLLAYEGIRSGDDINYLTHAREMAVGTYQLTAHTFWNRWGLLLPEALVFYLFGPRAFVLTLYPLVLGVALIYLTYLLCRLVAGKDAVGLLAALLVATLPLAVNESSIIVTDLPCAAFITLGLLLVYYCFEMAGRRRALLMFISGLCLGWAYLTKEQAVIIFPVYFIFTLRDLIRDYKLIWSWCVFGLGALIFPVGEAIYCYAAAGDPFFRYAGVESALSTPFYVREVIDQGMLGKRLWVDLVDRLVTRTGEFGLIFPLAAAGTAWAVTVGTGRLRMTAVWLWLFLLTFNFMSASVSEYLPLLVVPRYLLPGVAPAAVLAGGLIYEVAVGLRTGAVSTGAWRGSIVLLAASIFSMIYNSVLVQFIFFALALTILVCLFRQRRGLPVGKGWRHAPAALLVLQTGLVFYVLLTPHPVRPYGKLDVQALAIADDSPELVVYSDPESIRMLKFLDGFKAPERFVDFLETNGDAPREGYLWRQDHRIKVFAKNNIPPPAWVSSPSPEWKILFERSHKKEKYVLYRLAPAGPD